MEITIIGIAISVLGSWIASVLAFPTFPVQYRLNSGIRLLWKKITRQSIGLNGRWLAVYDMPQDSGKPEQRKEIVKCHQLSGGEIRGSIYDADDSTLSYRFLGRLVFDELVAHYWSVDASRDIGAFQIRKERRDILTGPLTVYDSQSKQTRTAIGYHWFRYPHQLLRTKVQARKSRIDGSGLFSCQWFKAGQKIGWLLLGNVSEQGKHTIQTNGKHRVVKEPWRFLNHSCEPNARLKWHEDRIALIALHEILPQNEITIDYNVLPEHIGEHFVCRCSKCSASDTPAKL